MPPYDPNVYVPPGVPPAVAYAIRTSGSRGVGAPPAALDMNALIGNDPMYTGQMNQIGWGAEGPTGGGMLGLTLAPLDEQYNANLINWGDIPAGMNVSNTIRGLASDATRGGMSVLAGLRRNQQYANSYATGHAAGLGLGHSGVPGQQMNLNSLNYDVGRASSQATLMDLLSKINQQKVAAYNTALGSAQTATSDAYQRVIGQINNGTIADPLASYKNPNLSYTPGGAAAAGGYGYSGAATAGSATGGYGYAGAATAPHAAPNPLSIPRTRTVTKQPITMPFHQGQPGNRFQILPGRGRAPIGGGTQWDISANPFVGHGIRALA